MTTETKPEAKENVYEESAERQMLEAWVCKHCGMPYVIRQFSENAEHHAKWCCAQDLPCQTVGCNNRTKKTVHSVYCNACIVEIEKRKWDNMPRKDWDGESTIAIAETDHFFYDSGSLADYLHEEGMRPDEVSLVHCRPDNGYQFDMADHLCDSLPDGEGLTADSTEVEKVVNDWLQKHGPFCWWQEDIVVTPESVVKAMESYGPFGDEDEEADS